MRASADELAPVEPDRPGARPHEADDRVHERRLADAVAPEQRDDLALVQVEVDALEDVARLS